MAGNINKIYIDLKGRDKTGKAFSSAQKRIGSLMTSLKGLIGIYAALAGAKWIIRSADQFKMLEARIQKASKGLGDWERSWQAIFAISQKTGTEFESTAKLFESLSRAAPDIGATQEQIIAITENLQMMAVTSGASGEEMRNAMRQLGQAVAGGVVRAEEFNSILENTPEIANQIAAALGKTPGELRKMVVEGELTSRELANAILAQTDIIRADFEKMPLTVERSMTMVSNSAKMLVGTMMSETGDAVGGLAVLLSGVSAAIDVIALSIKNGDFKRKFEELMTPVVAVKDALVLIVGEVVKISEKLWEATEPAREVFGDVMVATILAVAATIENLIGTVGGLIAIFAEWSSGSISATEAIKKAIGFVQYQGEQLWDSLSSIASGMSHLWDGPAKMLETVFFSAKTKVVAMFESMKVTINNIWTAVTDHATAAWEGAVDIFTSIGDKVVAAVLKPIKWLRKVLPESWRDTFDEMVGITEEGRAEINAQGEGIVKDAVGNTWARDFADGLSEWFGISKATMIENMEGARKEVKLLGEEMVNDAYDWAGNFAKATQGMFDDIAGGIGDAFGNLFKDIANGNKDALKNFGKALKDTVIDAIAGGIKEVITNRLKDAFAGIGEKIFGGIAGSIGGGGSGGGFIGSIASKVAGALGLGGGGAVAGHRAVGLFANAAGSGGGGMAGAGGIISKISGAISKGFSGVSSALSGSGGALAGAAGIAGIAAIAGFGFMKSAKYKKLLRGRFEEAMSDPVISGNVASESLGAGFKILGEKGERTFVQLGKATSKYFDDLQVKGRGAFGGDEADIFGSMKFGLAEMKDEFGNVIYSVKEFQTLMDELSITQPLIDAVEQMDGLGQGFKGELSDMQLAVEMFVMQEHQMAQATEAMADGFISKAEAMSMGFGQFADSTAEDFKKFLDSALYSASGLTKMGSAGVKALQDINLSSRQASQAMSDGFVSSTELAKMGLSGLREMGSAAFMQLVTAAQGAAFAARDFGDATASAASSAAGAIGGAVSAMNSYTRAAQNAANTAQHAINVSQAAKLPGFATGGSFTVGGKGGVDTNVVAFRATKGEKVTIETPEQQKASSGAEATHSLLAEIAESIRRSDANNVRAIQRAQFAEAANSRH